MASSPPLTPIRNYMSPIDTSPTNSYRESLRRRNSSFSSNHDRSPASARSRHRFSNASAYSNELLTPADENGGGGGRGLGNLADELDQLDDDQEYEEDADVTEDALDNADRLHAEQEALEHIRDSGVDVSYTNSRKSSPKHVRNFSKPFAESEEKPPDEQDEDTLLTPELEDCISAVYRMAQYADATEDPLIPRAIAQMQDLGNQTTLEAAAQRLNTSTNSMSSHLGKETRALQTLSASLYSPFVLAGGMAGLDVEAVEQVVPMIEALLHDLPLPQPDEDTLKGIQKLSYETERTIQTLSQLTDTLQMGKQTTNTAARHLRTTQTMVEELRRERERAESAREELSKSGFHDKIRDRWCKSECSDVVSGFEDVCRDLRESLEKSVQAAA